jgi:Mg2+ and Co2+ transporter CorA
MTGRARKHTRRPNADAEDAGMPSKGVAGSETDAPDVGTGLSAFLYDADGDDHEVALDGALMDGLADSDLLWVDLDSSREAVAAVAELLPVDVESLSVAATSRPFIHDFGDSFVLGVLPFPPSMAKPESEALICAVGHNWLVTVHDGEVGSLSEFAGHLRGDSALGRLDAPSFLAGLLEWMVNGYLDHLDDLHATIDDLEEGILRDRADNDVVARLVQLRHEIGRLRRRLAPHRQVFATLAHPSFDVISGSSSAREFAILADRLEMAVHAVDNTREMVVGAFDVFMTQTAQRTNNVMRVLTIVALTLLPATLIAGILGVNMLPKYLLHPWALWAGIGLMVVIAATVLLTMRLLRRWL